MAGAIRFAIIAGIGIVLVGCSGTNTSRNPARLIVTTPPSPTVHPYAENTSDATREAHRQALGHLRAGRFVEACDTLDGVPANDRRRITEYLTVLCMTRIPSLALSADGHGDRALLLDEPPSLLDAERTSLVRHRAWIAAIQDDLAHEAELSVPGFTPPLLPPALIGSHDLARLVAWKQRGTDTDHDADTYNHVRSALQTKNLATRLAISNLINRPSTQGPGDPLTLGNVHTLLFADLTGMTVPAPPPMSLPPDDQL
jgi:hypothetical protein